MERNFELLKQVLSIPTKTYQEDLMIDFITEWLDENKIPYYVDNFYNIYATKQTDENIEYFPCVVAHTDTVHTIDSINVVEEQLPNAQKEVKLSLKAYNDKGEPTGIGGDDKCGVYICLEMLLQKDCLKAAFFVSEEIGMLGSKQADPKFFEDVGYALQFDAPTGNWFSVQCSGTKLWTEEFESVVKPVLMNEGVTNFSYDPFTDVVQLRKKFDFCCAVLFSGYYRQHSVDEYVVIEDVEKSLKTGSKLIESLGLKKYVMSKDTPVSKSLIN